MQHTAPALTALAVIAAGLAAVVVSDAGADGHASESNEEDGPGREEVGWQGDGPWCPAASDLPALLACAEDTIRDDGFIAPDAGPAQWWRFLATAAHADVCPTWTFWDAAPRAWLFVDGSGTYCVVADADTDGDGLQDHGWGFLVVRLGSAGVHLQAPHPRHDMGTYEMGAAMFGAGGRSLAVAGAHRAGGTGSDVAHAAGSMFQVSHVSLPGGDVVQLHGMAADSCPGTDVFVTAGEETAADDLVAMLRQRAPSWRIDGEGSSGCHLAGSTNLQAATVPDGVAFIHIEAAPLARDPAVWAGVA